MNGSGRQGRRLSLLGAAALVVLAVAPARAHGAEFDVAVEAVSLSGDPGRIAYGIVLTFADGDPVDEADVVVTAMAPGHQTTARAAETVPGTYVAELSLHEAASWEVEVTVEHPSTEGSVAFTEVVPSEPLGDPVVRVDTADPSREGLPAGDKSALSGGFEGGAAEPAVVRVEALVRDEFSPLVVVYGVLLAAPAGSVDLEARADDGEAVALSLTPIGGDRFIGTAAYPTAAKWSVSIMADGVEVASFGENLPWPHFTTEAGFPKIKADPDPDLLGTLTSIAESPLFGDPVAATETTPPSTTLAGGPETTTSVPSTTETVSPARVSLPDNASEIRRQLGLRWFHLTALGAWVLGVVGVRLGAWRGWKVFALAGMGAMLLSGLALALWATPIGYPGLLRWSELGSRLYGPSYQVAFVAKMVFAAVGVLGTALLVTRSSWKRFGIVAGSLVAAVGMVAAMSQFHLYAHL